MPVRFICTQCNTLLSVGRKKIGADIQCPKCACAVRVPPEDTVPPPAAAKSTAPTSSTGAANGTGPANTPAPAGGTGPGSATVSAATAPVATASTATGTATLERPPQPSLTAGTPLAASTTSAASTAVASPEGQTQFWLGEGEIEGLIQEFIIYDDGEGLASPTLAGPTYAVPTAPAVPKQTAAIQAAPVPAVPATSAVASGVPIAAPAVPALAVPPPMPATLAPGTQAANQPAAAKLQAIPEGMVLVSRRMLFVQFALVLALLGGAFGAGYTLGHGDAKPQSALNTPVEPAIEPVTVKGKLVYLAQPGKLVGDQGAVVMILPEDVYPSQKVRTQGLRPTDAVDLTHERAAVELLQAGGVQVRADGKGEFMLNVPRPGKYHLLIVSRNTDRGKAAEASDLVLLNRYFDDAGQLLGPRKYYLAPMQFVGSFMELPPHQFGAVK